ncbi:MAG TPA: hypothetical protein PLD27_05360, partial [bacterium]|nr:hypothetical protein [bacterium]
GKNFDSKIYNKLSMKLFNISIHDNNWVKAFRKEVIKKIHLRKGWYRYIVPIAAAEGFRITEIKLNWYPRKYGKSKFGAMRILPGVIDLLRVKFKINYLEEPMSLFGYSGLILTIVSVFLIVCLLFLKIFNLISTLLFIVFLIILFLLGILGVQILSIGFIGEMIAQMNDKIMKIEEKITDDK